METQLRLITSIGEKYVVKWYDEDTQECKTEDVTEEYHNSYPTPKPSSYTKTQEDWEHLLKEPGQVGVFGGRTVYDTTDGNPYYGDIEVFENGYVNLYLSDWCKGKGVLFEATEYTGTAPNITLNNPIQLPDSKTLNIINGILTIV